MTTLIWQLAIGFLAGVLVGWILRQRSTWRPQRRGPGLQERLLLAEQATQQAEEAARGARSQLHQQAHEIEALTDALEGSRHEVRSRTVALAAADERRGELAARLAKSEVEHQEILRSQGEADMTMEAELARQMEQLEVLAQELSIDRRRRRALQAEVDAANERSQNLEAQLRSLKSDRQEQQADALRKELETLERKLANPESGSGPRAAAAGEEAADDLRKIRGIGAATESKLHAMGVRSFRQIAAWGEADLERFAVETGVPASRIRREGWVDGARQRHREKLG